MPMKNKVIAHRTRVRTAALLFALAMTIGSQPAQSQTAMMQVSETHPSLAITSAMKAPGDSTSSNIDGVWEYGRNPLVIVPDLSLMTVAQAEQELRSVGLYYVFVGLGNVCRQTPRAGALVEPGTVVLILLAGC